MHRYTHLLGECITATVLRCVRALRSWVTLKAFAGLMKEFMCRAATAVHSVPAGGAHAVPEAPLPLRPGSAGGLLGLPLLQPAQCPARKRPLPCPALLTFF